MWLTKVNIKQSLALILLVCCCTLVTTAESLAGDDLKIDQQSVMEKKLLVGQPEKPASSHKLFEFSLRAGYRKDNLNWSEAGGSVNIISELKWENLEIAQISSAAKLNFNSEWSLRGMLGYGSIYSGRNQDSDYNGNNRTLEFSRSNNKAGGEVRDASIGLGRTIQLLDNAGEHFLSVTPLVGLSIHQQNLTMTDGVQTLPATGSFPGLNSSYDAQWQGPWVGMDILLESGLNWTLSATAEYHWADYSAHANWNLRPEFSHPVSFTHAAKGQGVFLAAGATYIVRKNWKIGMTVEVQQWSTGSGIDQTSFSDGTVGYYPLNGVNWESTSVNFGMVYSY